MDYNKMLFALELAREANLKRSRYINQLPEHKRDSERKKYSFEVALKEAYAETTNAARLIDTLEQEGQQSPT